MLRIGHIEAGAVSSGAPAKIARSLAKLSHAHHQRSIKSVFGVRKAHDLGNLRLTGIRHRARVSLFAAKRRQERRTLKK